MVPHTPCRARRSAALLALSFLIAGAAHAQVRHLDVTQMNSQFSTSSSAASFGQTWNANTPTIDQSMNTQRVTLGTYDSKMSSLNGMQSSPQWHTTFSNNHMMEMKMMDQPELKQPTMDRLNGQQSSLSHYTDYGEWKHPSIAPDYDDAWVVHSGDYSPAGQGTGKELSMQDINRYEFSSSRSSEPGLPVTHAGTGGPTTSAGGTIVNTPALFDFGDGMGANPAPTSSVHSGGMVAPQMITPGGDVRPMEPTHQDTSDLPPSRSSPPPAPPSNSSQAVPGSAPGPVPTLNVNHSYAPLDPSRADEVKLYPPQVWARVLD